MTNDIPRKLVYDHETGMTEYIDLTIEEMKKYEQDLEEFEAQEQKSKIGE